MTNNLTTQQVSEGAVKGQNLSLPGVGKVKSPAKRDKAAQQVANFKGVELESVKQKLAEDPEKVKELVKETADFFKQFVKDVQVDLRYEIDDKTNEVIVKFYEKGTDKLIRQVPPEAILNLKQRINDLLGIIYDETA